MKKLLALLTLFISVDVTASSVCSKKNNVRELTRLEKLQNCISTAAEQVLLSRFEYDEAMVSEKKLTFTQQEFEAAFKRGKLELAAFILPRTQWEGDRTGDYWYDAIKKTQYIENSLEKAQFLARNNKIFKLDAELLADLNAKISETNFTNKEKKQLRTTLNKAPNSNITVNTELLLSGKQRTYGTCGKK